MLVGFGELDRNVGRERCRPGIGLHPLAQKKNLRSNSTARSIQGESHSSREPLKDRAPMLRKMTLAVLVTAFAGGVALAQETCESKAVGKDGKPLAGAAKTSFMKKCLADTCATKAVSQDGKPLSGAAKASFMKKCEKGA